MPLPPQWLLWVSCCVVVPGLACQHPPSDEALGPALLWEERTCQRPLQASWSCEQALEQVRSFEQRRDRDCAVAVLDDFLAGSAEHPAPQHAPCWGRRALYFEEEERLQEAVDAYRRANRASIQNAGPVDMEGALGLAVAPPYQDACMSLMRRAEGDSRRQTFDDCL